MPTEDFDVDAALNRIVSTIAPHRQAAHEVGTTAELMLITNAAVSEALNALGVPLTQDIVNSLLFAAVLRLADMWNGENVTIEIPDSL